MQDNIYRQLIWDYTLSKEDFESILSGQKTLGSLDQSWAISRILENTDYYTAKDLVTLPLLQKNWSQVKNKLFKKSIKDGYEFVLQRHALSPTK